MKISVDGKDLYELSETQKKVIKNDIHEDIFDSDMCRRLHWVLNHKYEQCMKRLEEQWKQKLCDRCDAVPTNPDKLAELIFMQPDYKCRKQRDEESRINENVG